MLSKTTMRYAARNQVMHRPLDEGDALGPHFRRQRMVARRRNPNQLIHVGRQRAAAATWLASPHLPC